MTFGIWQLTAIYFETLLKEAEVATLEEYLSSMILMPHDVVVRITERAEAAAWEAYDSVPAPFRAPVSSEELRQAVANIFESAA